MGIVVCSLFVIISWGTLQPLNIFPIFLTPIIMSGTQSILDMDKFSLLNEYERKLIHYGDAIYAKEKFLVGEGVTYDQMLHTRSFYRLLHTDNCELVEYLKKQIEGEIGCEQTNLSEYIKEYKGCNIDKQDCSDTEIIAECCQISNVGKKEW